jgi:HNH endonuclease
MTNKRPKIPSDLRRRVLIEAGHQCAIPACRSTPVEIAHIIPWSMVQKHEFKNLIALCPTCHTRYDNPHGSIDRASMRKYKVNLNPLLAFSNVDTREQVRLLSAYQEFRAYFAKWIASSLNYAKVKGTKNSTLSAIKQAKSEATEAFSWVLGGALDFQHAFGDSEESGLAGAIFCHIAEWNDEVAGSEFPVPQIILRRDVLEEISEAAAELHLTVCERIGL